MIYFHYVTYTATPLHKYSWPGGHEIYNFDKPFFGYHNFTVSLSVICLGVEKKIFKETMHFHHMTYMATSLNKNPCPRGHELYNFSKLSSVIISIHLVYMDHAP